MSTPDLAALGPPRLVGRRPAVVAGFGVSGFAAADNLLFLGAAGDRARRGDRPGGAEKAELLETLGADRPARSTGATATLPDDVDVARHLAGLEARPRRCSRRPRPAASRSGARSSSPGGCATPSTPHPGWPSPAPTARPPPCRCSTSILRAAGLRSAAVGNVGRPVVEAVMDPEPYDVFAVELSASSSTTPSR